MINFPLWKAAAIGQSGFKEAADFYGRMRLIFGPPYKGVAATIFGMTWARAAIFYGSDVGKEHLLQNGWSPPLASTLPPIGISAFVQVANQPIVRATIQLQDPSSTQPNVLAQLMELFRKRGWRALYHGSSASVLKTVPKYVCAIWVKDWVALKLPPPTAPVGHPEHKQQVLCRAAAKSIAAGVAGAALTNPLDVIRNEMFKYEVRSMCRRSVAARADPTRARTIFFACHPHTRSAVSLLTCWQESFSATCNRLLRTEGWAFCTRGMQRNLVAVAAPIGMTIFLTEALTETLRSRQA